MKISIICFLSSLLLFGVITTILAVKKQGNVLTSDHNIEVLAEDEEINIITCLPEDGSICISDIEDVIMINQYFSPH